MRDRTPNTKHREIMNTTANKLATSILEALDAIEPDQSAKYLRLCREALRYFNTTTITNIILDGNAGLWSGRQSLQAIAAASLQSPETKTVLLAALAVALTKEQEQFTQQLTAVQAELLKRANPTPDPIDATVSVAPLPQAVITVMKTAIAALDDYNYGRHDAEALDDGLNIARHQLADTLLGFGVPVPDEDINDDQDD
jgi:hypothetical protein